MSRFLLLMALMTGLCSVRSVYAIDYLVHIENRGFEDFVGDGELPRDEILSSMQFIVSSDKPSRARLSSGPTLVTAKVAMKSDEAGMLHLDVEFSEKRRVPRDVAVGDGVHQPMYSTSTVETTAAVKLGESQVLGCMGNSSTTKANDGSDVRKTSRHAMVLRVTEYKPGELTPEEVEEADQAALVGVWNASELVLGGQPADEATVKTVEFKFHNPGQCSARGLDSTNEVHRFDFELEAGSTIKRVTVFPVDGRWKGIPIGAIYELKEDVLRIAIQDFESADPPSKPKNSKFGPDLNFVPIDFPAKFESAAGSSIRLITLKRKRGNS